MIRRSQLIGDRACPPPGGPSLNSCRYDVRLIDDDRNVGVFAWTWFLASLTVDLREFKVILRFFFLFFLRCCVSDRTPFSVFAFVSYDEE